MEMQSAGPGMPARAEPVVGPPLTTRQVIIAVVVVLLFLAFIVFYVGGGLRNMGRDRGDSGGYPVLGAKGDVVRTGNTGWGVAFTEEPKQVNDEPPGQGRYYAVGVVVLNQGERPAILTTDAVALINDEESSLYRPKLVAWGTPEELNAGRGQARYTLPPQEVVAGLAIFDVPDSVNEPRLLVRDVNAEDKEFSGAIDLTRESDEGRGGCWER